MVAVQARYCNRCCEQCRTDPCLTLQAGAWGVASVSAYLPMMILGMGWYGYRTNHWWLLWIPAVRRNRWKSADRTCIAYSALTFGAGHILLVSLGLLSVLWESRSRSEVLCACNHDAAHSFATEADAQRTCGHERVWHIRRDSILLWVSAKVPDHACDTVPLQWAGRKGEVSSFVLCFWCDVSATAVAPSSRDR